MKRHMLVLTALIWTAWASQAAAVVKTKPAAPSSSRSTEQVDDQDAQRAAKDLQVRRVQNMLSSPRPQNSQLSRDP